MIKTKIRRTVRSKWRGQTWKLLNQPFTLFILGSIVLSSTVYAFSNYRTCRQKQSDDNRRLERLEFELLSRYRKIEGYKLVGDYQPLFRDVHTLIDFRRWHLSEFAFEYDRIRKRWNIDATFGAVLQEVKLF